MFFDRIDDLRAPFPMRRRTANKIHIREESQESGERFELGQL